jgi:small GTP-binding protein
MRIDDHLIKYLSYFKLFEATSKLVMFQNVLKVIVIGDSQVGKTKLAIRFADGVYTAESMTTIGVDFKDKTVNLDGTVYKLQIWDTAGQEKFRTITESYYRRARGALIVYDVSNLDSFQNAEIWFDSLFKVHQNTIPVLLVGNKCDLPHLVPDNDARVLAEKHHVDLFFTSAKTGDGIDETFEKLARLVIEHADSAPPEIASTGPPSVQISGAKSAKKKKCVC